MLIDPGPIGREEKPKHSALPWRTVDLNRAPSTLDEVGTYRQPESHPLAVLLGRKEGFKDQPEVLGRNPTARIRDPDTEAPGLAGGGVILL